MSVFPYDVKFRIVKEDWNEYKLSDGVILRTKLTLGKIVTPPGVPPEDATKFSFNTQSMIIVYVPQSMKGTPVGHHLSPQEIQESIVEDLDFEPIKQVWNEYKLPNGIDLKLKIELTRVAKTDKYNSNGTPIYTTQTQIVPRVKLSKKLIRKIKAKEKRREPVTHI